MFKSHVSNVCIDIGGTNTRVALIDNEQIVDIKKFPTNQDPQLNFQLITKVIDKWKFSAIGVSTAGPILENGIYGQLPNLPKYQGFDIYHAFDRYKVPIVVAKDANCSAYAEHQSADHSTLYITISTGIGGGFVVDNQIYHGSSNNALELHRLKTPTGISIEDICSGPAIYQSAISAGLKVNTTADVFELAITNTVANEIIIYSVDVLASAVANVEAILNPTTIIFGGSVVQNNPNYYQLLRVKIQDKMASNPQIKLATDSESSTLYGINKLLRSENESI